MSGWDCVRAAKSRSDWTGNELIAYNIEIATETTEQFFGAASVGVSLAHLDPLIIAGFADTENLSDATLRYLTHLDHAVHASQESLIDEFSRQTLDLLGYSERGLTLYTRYNIPLTICGEDKEFTDRRMPRKWANNDLADTSKGQDGVQLLKSRTSSHLRSYSSLSIQQRQTGAYGNGSPW